MNYKQAPDKQIPEKIELVTANSSENNRLLDDFVHKKWIIYYMLKGCLLFNLLAIGVYHAYHYLEPWIISEPLEFDLLGLDTKELRTLAEQIDDEIDYRTATVKPKK